MMKKDFSDVVMACAKRNFDDAIGGDYSKSYVRDSKNMLLGMACVLCDISDFDGAHEIMRMVSKLEDIINPV